MGFQLTVMYIFLFITSVVSSAIENISLLNLWKLEIVQKCTVFKVVCLCRLIKEWERHVRYFCLQANFYTFNIWSLLPISQNLHFALDSFSNRVLLLFILRELLHKNKMLQIYIYTFLLLSIPCYPHTKTTATWTPLPSLLLHRSSSPLWVFRRSSGWANREYGARAVCFFMVGDWSINKFIKFMKSLIDLIWI